MAVFIRKGVINTSKFPNYLIEAIVITFLVLFLSWWVGYICNGLFGTKFDLKSCWDGFTALSGAGVLSAIKYVMDSWKNSNDGEKPY